MPLRRQKPGAPPQDRDAFGSGAWRLFSRNRDMARDASTGRRDKASMSILAGLSRHQLGGRRPLLQIPGNPPRHQIERTSPTWRGNHHRPCRRARKERARAGCQMAGIGFSCVGHLGRSDLGKSTAFMHVDRCGRIATRSGGSSPFCIAQRCSSVSISSLLKIGMTSPLANGNDRHSWSIACPQRRAQFCARCSGAGSG